MAAQEAPKLKITHPNDAAEQAEPERELAIYEVTGDWGLYQWSTCMFAILYSAIFGVTVVAGPIWTPEMSFVCAADPLPVDVADPLLDPSLLAALKSNISALGLHECRPSNGSGLLTNLTSDTQTSDVSTCTKFIYDDRQLGLTLTNAFDLVCDRQWLRSLVSSSALAGMLISSITLGLLSDWLGRLRCIQVGYTIALLANVLAILAHNYILFNVCIFFMSYAQVGAANALSTLVMESTSPRFRAISSFEYGVGWGLGVMLVPLFSYLTTDYRYFLALCLGYQLLMLPWLLFGISESIRWLLSEGHINRAQIELGRACRMNRVRTNARLAKNIAQIHTQRLRKASRVLDDELAPSRLAHALETEVGEAAYELDMLSAAIKRSFGLDEGEAESEQESPQPTVKAEDSRDQLVLSPKLVRESFSLQPGEPLPQQLIELQQKHNQLQRNSSLSGRALAELALKYSKTVEEQEEGSCFLVRLFHPKLRRQTVVLLLMSVMFETTYYGLVQANKFVGTNVALNYLVGGLVEWLSACCSLSLLAALSRRSALILPTLLAVVACLGMSLTYHLLPERPLDGATWPDSSGQPEPMLLLSEIANETGAAFLGSIEPETMIALAATLPNQSNIALDSKTQIFKDQIDELIISDNIKLAPSSDAAAKRNESDTMKKMTETVELRHSINFYLMHGGKFAITVAIQVASCMIMELYPNNLRQTGAGVIIFFGRICSIVSPFLFNDPTPEKRVFKLTLLVLGCIGITLCIFVPFTLKDKKHEDLCDRLHELDDEKKDKKC